MEQERLIAKTMQGLEPVPAGLAALGGVGAWGWGGVGDRGGV